MKNKDILLLSQALPHISPPEMDRWFNYAVQETIQRAESKAVSIKSIIKPKEKMAEYQEKLKKLQEEYSNKDEYGQPIKQIDIIGGMQRELYDIPDMKNPKGDFNVAIDELESEYDASIKEYKEGLKFLDEDNPDFEPYWITVDQIPNGLTRAEMSAIFLMIKKQEQKA